MLSHALGLPNRPVICCAPSAASRSRVCIREGEECSILAARRKGHGESRALPFPAALCADSPAVQLDQVPHDCEAEPESAVCPGECRTPTLTKAVEDVGQEVASDTLAGITDGDRRTVLLDSPQLDRNPSAPRGELDCIGKEIPHPLGQPTGVP